MLTADLVTLGKDEANDLVIDAPGVSDFHAEVSRSLDRDAVRIVDLLSGSGTFVNGNRISGITPLQAWDVIRLGSVELELNDPNVSREAEWSLQLIRPDGTRSLHPLARTMIIGRDHSCDIVLESDLLSRRHAALRMDAGRIEVEDLGSANGTYLNGRPIARAVAFANDELRIEPYWIKIVGPPSDARSQSAGAMERTQVKAAAPDSDTQRLYAGSARSDDTELLGAGRGIGCLVERSSFLDGQRVNLIKSSYTIGRRDDNDVIIGDSSISKYHARITQARGEWTIEDLNSSNGVLVNDAIVERTALTEGDIIVLGRAEFVFQILPDRSGG